MRRFNASRCWGPKMEESVEALLERHRFLEQQRQDWLQIWQDCADYIIPRKSLFTQRASTAARQNNVTLYESTAVWANEQFASGMQSYLTPGTERWFTYRIKYYTEGLENADISSSLNDDDDVKAWLEIATNTMYNMFSNQRAGFSTHMHEVYLDLGAFGNGALMIEENFDPRHPPAVFNSFHLSECCIDEDRFGFVDTFFRKYTCSPRVAIQHFGQHPMLMEIYNSKTKQDVEILHCIYPRTDYNPQKLDAANMPYASKSILLSKKTVLKDSGYREFPVMFPRFTKITGNRYGKGPGITALPDVKMINEMAKTLLKASQKAVDPPLMLPDEGFLLPIKTHPGGLNFYSAGLDERNRIEQMPISPNIPLGKDVMDSRREHILRCFFLDWMQLNEGPEMTATEVMQRTEDRMRMMSPAVSRIQSEGLDTLHERCFNIAMRRGLIPPPPEVLRKAGVEVKVEYTSPVAKAQQRTQAFGFARVLELIAPLGQVKPEIYDPIDPIGTIETLKDMFDVPSNMIMSRTDTEKFQKARDEKVNQMQQAEQDKLQSEAARNNAQAVGTLAKAPQTPALGVIQGGKPA